MYESESVKFQLQQQKEFEGRFLYTIWKFSIYCEAKNEHLFRQIMPFFGLKQNVENSKYWNF